jgi:hypothetical protein
MERNAARVDLRWRRIGAVVLGLAIVCMALIPGYSGFFRSVDTDCGAPLHDAAWGTPGCNGGLGLRVAMMGVIVVVAVAETAPGFRRRIA